MTDNLHSLAYFSRNAMGDDPATLERNIANILATARERNAAAGITGALLFAGGCFAQVIEGPRPALEALFETIQCDPRHKDATILHFHPVAARSFPQWSMAFAGRNQDTRARAIAAQVSIDPAAIEAGTTGQDFIALLQDLVLLDEAYHEAA